jgi:hypothetical protein
LGFVRFFGFQIHKDTVAAGLQNTQLPTTTQNLNHPSLASAERWIPSSALVDWYSRPASSNLLLPYSACILGSHQPQLLSPPTDDNEANGRWRLARMVSMRNEDPRKS